MLVIPTISGNEEPDVVGAGEPRDDLPPLSNGRLCAGAPEKISRTFAHSVGLFINKLVPTSDFLLVFLIITFTFQLDS